MRPYDRMTREELIRELVRKDALSSESTGRDEVDYHDIFARMNVGFLLCDIICDDSGNPVDYRFVETNEFFEKETGLRSTVVKGKTVLELFPDVERSWIETYGRVALTGESARFEFFNHNTGRFYEVFAFSPVKGRFAALARDITDAKQAQEDVRQSEERYRMLFMSIREGFFLTKVLFDGNGVPCDYLYLEMNPAFGEIIGFQPDDIVGKTLKEAFPNFTPLWMELFTQVALSSAPCHCCYFSEPFRRYFELFAFKLADDQIAVLVTDITERQQTDQILRKREARLRLFIEHAPVSIAMFDRNMRYLSASKRWREAHRMAGRDLAGLSYYDILPETTVAWREAHRRGLAGEVVRSAGDRFERSDGSVQWMRWEIQPWYERPGVVGGIVIYAEDITGLMGMQEELRIANERLEKRVKERTADLEAAIREQESFSYSVSHDLRAPLRHINSFSSMLADDFSGVLPPRACVYVERIRAASDRMGDLIDHLLELSRVSRTEIAIRSVDLSGLASSILRTLQETDPERRVETIVEDDITVLGDVILLRQLLENLLGNAWKYTSRRHAARIEFGRSSMSGKDTYFVKDNGVGFDMKYQGKMFHAFERLHGPEFEGIGIGLATAKRIVERHGGAIWAEGRVEKGATFYFTLGTPCI